MSFVISEFRGFTFRGLFLNFLLRITQIGSDELKGRRWKADTGWDGKGFVRTQQGTVEAGTKATVVRTMMWCQMNRTTNSTMR
jgi:hypothetical protein